MKPGDAVARRLDELFGDEFAPGGDFDLAPLNAALEALGNPHRKFPPTIHVAGTNGKGSTCAFLRAIAEAAGINAHVFTKPHLLHTRERVRLAGRLVSDAAFLDAIDRVAATQIPLRHFEAQVAAAFLLFAEIAADLLILEAGVGGLHDATNVIARPALAMLTPIDIDHAAILGHTRAEIAAHKAGILKPGAPAIIARQSADALAVIEDRAERIGAPLRVFGRDWDAYAANGRLIVQSENRLFDLPPPALLGAHQIENAGAAIIALSAFSGQRVDEDAFARGIERASLPARMQRLPAERREIWLDGAHNSHAALALARTLDDLAARAPRPVTLIIGMLTRKDGDGFLAALAPKADLAVATTLAHADCIAPDELARLAAAHGAETRMAENLNDALAQARAHNADARIVICGSLALAAEAYTLFGLTID